MCYLEIEQDRVKQLIARIPSGMRSNQPTEGIGGADVADNLIPFTPQQLRFRLLAP